MKIHTARPMTGALLALALCLGGAPAAWGAAFVVNHSIDPGDGVCDMSECTLREAIEAANGNGEPDTITFDLEEGGREILLGGTELEIANDTADPDLTIDGGLDGDGKPVITVNAQASSRVFHVASGASATLKGLVITGGFSDGGGIFNQGTLTVTHSTLSGNSADDEGGGIFNRGTLNVTHSTVSGNSAGINSTSRGDGGGISNSGGTVVLSYSTVSDNKGVGGGGIHNNGGTVTVSYSTVSGNSSEGFQSLAGGGIHNHNEAGTGTVTVSNSTVSGNTTRTGGGGILNNVGTVITVSNSTVSGNTVPHGTGGGIHNLGTLNVTHSTVSGNTALLLFPDPFSPVGGIRNEGSTTLTNSIVANNTGGDCVNEGTLNAQGVNLVGDGSCGFPVGGDPLLDTLANNGGPTQTHALLPGSDAIDTAADEFCPETDQQGVSRPQPFPDGNCDIGAFELVQEASITIADVIDLFDQAVANGTLVDAGPGNSAAGRLNALRNMLLAAGDLLDQADIDAACSQLQDLADRTDGHAPPPDFVSGTAAPDLLEAVTALQHALGCFG